MIYITLVDIILFLNYLLYVLMMTPATKLHQSTIDRTDSFINV